MDILMIFIFGLQGILTQKFPSGALGDSRQDSLDIRDIFSRNGIADVCLEAVTLIPDETVCKASQSDIKGIDAVLNSEVFFRDGLAFHKPERLIIFAWAQTSRGIESMLEPPVEHDSDVLTPSGLNDTRE